MRNKLYQNFTKLKLDGLFSQLQLLQMDLSNSIIPVSALESIICHCGLLEYLSLEGLKLSDTIVR